MATDTHQTLEKLQRRYPGLELVDRGEKIKFPWLRYQAHHVFTERVVLPAIHRIRSAMDQIVTTRKLVAFGQNPDDLGKLLAKA